MAEHPWKFVGCPECHLNKFSVKTMQTRGTEHLPAVDITQIECLGCKHILTTLGKNV